MQVKLAINEVKYTIIVYCKADAIKNPIGFFVSNGNLKQFEVKLSAYV